VHALQSDMISAKAPAEDSEGGRRKTQDARTNHGLDANIVDNVTCVTSIDDGAHIGDRLARTL
jgi:hypothetical protein